MLPPWLLATSDPATSALSILMLPVPPAAVLTEIVVAAGPALSVPKMPAVCDTPWVPDPSVFAVMLMAPELDTRSAAMTTSSLLESEMFPLVVLVEPETVSVPLVLAATMFPAAVVAARLKLPARLTISIVPAPVAVALRVTPSASETKAIPAPAATVRYVACVWIRLLAVPIPLVAVRLTVGAATRLEGPAVMVVADRFAALPGLTVPVRSIVTTPDVVTVPVGLTVPPRVNVGMSANERLPVVVTAPVVVSDPPALTVTLAGPASRPLIVSVPSHRLRFSDVTLLAGPVTEVVPSPVQPAAIAAVLKVIGPAVSVIV